MRKAMSSAAAVLDGDDGWRDVAAANPPAVARYTMRARAPLFMRDGAAAGANVPQVHEVLRSHTHILEKIDELSRERWSAVETC
jgi:hypothetical protein